MATNASIDANHYASALAVDTNGVLEALRCDPSTGRLLIDFSIVSDGGNPSTSALKIDDNHNEVAFAVTDDVAETASPLFVDTRNGLLYCDVTL